MPIGGMVGVLNLLQSVAKILLKPPKAIEVWTAVNLGDFPNEYRDGIDGIGAHNDLQLVPKMRAGWVQALAVMGAGCLCGLLGIRRNC